MHGIQFEKVAIVVFLLEDILALVVGMVDAVILAVLTRKRSGHGDLKFKHLCAAQQRKCDQFGCVAQRAITPLRLANSQQVGRHHGRGKPLQLDVELAVCHD